MYIYVYCDFISYFIDFKKIIDEFKPYNGSKPLIIMKKVYLLITL